MKTIVVASVMALACSVFVATPTSRAQDPQGQGAQGQGNIQIKDPAEFNAYQMFSTQTDPKAKAAAGESFLKSYPNSVVKGIVLDQLIDDYQQTGDQENLLNATSRLLQVEPNNLKALLFSVFVKKQQCAKSQSAQDCDDAASLSQKGLQAPKPASVAEDEWKKQTGAAYPVFHSAIALDDTVSKKDFKAAQAEYESELHLYSEDQSKSVGLNDTLLLAQAYSMPGSAQDLVKASYFYARVWDFAPANYKAQIEPKLEYYYKKYHGGLDGLQELKTQAQQSAFPPGNFTITKAKSPQEQIHDLITQTPDLSTLALSDKETILAYGSKDDADKMWTVLQGKQTPVPGIVISADANQIKVAVTQDAKDTKTPDFIVNLKEPLKDADLKLYQPGFEFKLQPKGAELDGTYDSYTQVPATDTTAQRAEIVLKEGFVQAEKKAPVHHPAATHHKAS